MANNAAATRFFGMLLDGRPRVDERRAEAVALEDFDELYRSDFELATEAARVRA